MEYPEYTEEDYLNELKREQSLGLINLIRHRKARKSYTCEVCGCEIPKGDYYYSYKPVPTNKYWFTWRKRCIDHEPRRYNEVELYEDHNSCIIQKNKRLDLKIN